MAITDSLTALHSDRQGQPPLITDDWHLSGAAYRDPGIFEAEMEAIFGRCWVFVAHESQLPNGGDYKQARVGRQPLIVIRGSDDGVIRVFFNRCRHRAAAVCQRERGSTNFLRCAYHGWTYSSDGRLSGVPFPDAYGDGFDKEAFGLVPVPRVESYRGFVFACLDPETPDLQDCIGHARRYIDYVADLDIEVAVRPQKVVYRGNWKLQLENTIDAYHFAFTHKSFMDIVKHRTGLASTFVRNIQSNPDWKTFDLRGGHAAFERGALDAEAGERGSGVGEILPFHLVLFPTLGLVASQVRVVCPVAVDRTDVYLYPLYPGNSTPAEREQILRDHESAFGPAGVVLTDDVEVAFERVTNGLEASATSEDWLLMSRGLEREKEDPETGIRWGLAADEVPQRAFYRRWHELLTDQT